MSCFLLIFFGWLLTVCSKRFIIRHCLHQRHQSIFSDHVSCPQRPSHKQSETKQSEMKYPMFEVWTRNHKLTKIFTSNTSFHIGFTVLSFVFVQNVLAPTGNRKKYHHELWCTYSKILIGVLKQWSCPNEFISSWRQSKWEIQKMT